MLKVEVHESDGTKNVMGFKSEKALKKAITFDGQSFWLGSELLGEVSESLKWNWGKLTDEVVNSYKDIYVRFLTEARAVKSKLGKVL